MKVLSEVLAQMKEQAREHHYGEARAESEQEHAESVVEEGLRRLRWKEADLAATRKGDPRKVKLAQRLRAETTATIK